MKRPNHKKSNLAVVTNDPGDKKTKKKKKTHFRRRKIGSELESDCKIVVMITHFTQSVPPLPAVVQRTAKMRLLTGDSCQFSVSFAELHFARHHGDFDHKLSPVRLMERFNQIVRVIVGHGTRSGQHNSTHAQMRCPGNFLLECSNGITLQRFVLCIQIDPRRNRSNNIV